MILHAAFICYAMVSIFILGMCVLLPFALSSNECPIWYAFIIYPIGLLIIVTQNKVINYFTPIL